ncbi:hypothetical protein M8J76_012171 [Diaphorina citri]|nr:hypothetical protein M8J76_012171 [Diaphorina citri]
MMAFVINNTPEQKSKKKKSEMPPEPPSYLVLMPFQPPAKLFFEHVKMGQEAKRILKIRNPSDNSIQVILDKLPDPKIGLALSQTEFTVDKNNEFIIEITFKPLLEGSGRECIHVKDVNKNKKISDIFINWESINPNPPKMKKKKPLALETKILTQNKVIGKKTHVKNTTVPNKPLWKSSYGYPSTKTNSTVTKSQKSEIVEDLPPCNVPGTPTRRQTYNVEDKENLDTNCGIYSNKQTRSPRIGRDTVLTPLPLLTVGRLKTKQNKGEDNIDRYSISSDCDPKAKQVQTIRNLQVSEDILHLGPSDDSGDEVVYLGNKTFRKQTEHGRRDTYLVTNTTQVKHTLPTQNIHQDRRNTYHVDNTHTVNNSNMYDHPIISDMEFTGQMFIEEEEIRETKIIRTPLCKRNSFGKRGSWDNADTSYDNNSRRNSIEMVNGKLRIRKSSLGKLYNEYRRRSTDRFSIDSLEAVEDIDVKASVNPLDGAIFDNLNFDNETISSPLEIPEYFNPRRTSTDLKQHKRLSLKNAKQSKKKMEFHNEQLENISEKAKNAFDESLNNLKSTTHDVFAALFNGIKPLEDVGNLSGISSIKSGDVDGTYLSEGKTDKQHDHPTVIKKDLAETYVKEKPVDSAPVEQPETSAKPLLNETYLSEKRKDETFVHPGMQKDLGETYVKERIVDCTFVQNKDVNSETFIKEKPVTSVAWNETFQKSCNATIEAKNATYNVQTYAEKSVNIPQASTASIDRSTKQTTKSSSVDIPDHALLLNPLKSINEKISSIEFDVIRCEQKHADIAGKFVEPRDNIPEERLASIPESNESKLPNTTSTDSFESLNQSISPTLGSTITSTGTDEMKSNRSVEDELRSKDTCDKEDKPTAWTVEISPPAKVVEEKKQPGSYDFLIKYQQPRTISRTIRKPSTTRTTRTLPSSTPKVNNKTAGDTLNETAKNKSLNSSTSSSDRSKNSSSDFLETSARSVSRKRRSNSSVDNEISGGKKDNETRQGPPPGKLLRASSQDAFKKPASKQLPVKPPVRKAAGLPMKSLSLGKKKKPREESVQFYNPEKIISDYTDSNLLIATSTSSTPFSVGSLYMDPKVLDDLERDNIKWLNSLLTPPIELECDAEGLWCVDIADLWLKSSRTQNIELAPSREKTAMKYHGQQDRLDALRKAAFQLFRSASMSPVLSKLSWHISKNLIEVRKDRDLHLDQGLQQKVISLLLCYNPLWLRIGLEAVYGCTVPLHHNNDVLGLTSFMRKHLVNDPYTRKQHSHPKVPNLMDASFADAMKKFILRKFLMVVYFLDRAKSTKLIRHDPCLFNKKSKYKDSAQLVIEFSRDLISGGDILRHLRTIGYLLEHKQTFLNEFDFSTKSLLDLRDGVRLARAMEIILHQKFLTKRLRAPAISRLQKVHNVEISISALQDAGYDIQDDITAKDIADGHREKTLSLLWQIIYKFQAPRILIRRKFIQLKNKLQEEKLQRLSATVTIQKYFRRYQARTRYRQLKTLALKLQRNYRRNKRVNTDRAEFLRLRQACITIQRFYRNYKLNGTYKKEYEQVKTSTVRIQRWYRNIQRAREERARYLALRRATVTCQRRFRATRLAVKARQEYILMKKCAVVLQRRYRAHRSMLAERKQYTDLKVATVTMQRRFRAKLLGKTQRSEFLAMKHAALVIQRKYRANQAMKSQRDEYMRTKRAAITIQNHFRSYKLMTSERARFVTLKEKVVYIQRLYRAKKLMTAVRAQYQRIIQATLSIQRRYRAYVDMKKSRAQFIQLRQACLVVQRRYRAQKLMQIQRSAYLQQRNACMVIQRRFRSYQTMQQCRSDYLNLRAKTILIQTLWRSKLAMRRDEREFCMIRSKTIVIQKYFRGYLLMRKERQEYLAMKSSAVKIQEWYRNLQCMRQARQQYLALKHATLVVQNRYRAQRAMRAEQAKYTQLRTKTICLQQHIRAYLLMKHEREQYNQLKRFTVLIQRNFRTKRSNQAASKIQNYYRGYKLMQKQREEFLKLKHATITIQTLYRAKLLMKRDLAAYTELKQACVSVQQRWRANLTMRKQRAHFLLMKQKASVIQQWYRNTKLMRLEASYLHELKAATITIQRRYRANVAMRTQRERYVALRTATITIQTRFRAYLIAKNQRDEYAELKQAVVNVQRRFRATRQMRVDLDAYTRLRQAACTIQSHYRQYARMKTQRAEYLRLKHAVHVIKTRYIAMRDMQTQRAFYLNLKQAVRTVETRYQARLAMRSHRERFLAMKASVLRIENWYLGKRVASQERHNYLELRFFTVMIQRRFRFKLNLRKYERVIELLKLKREQERQEKYRHQCAVKIQSLWKMYRVRKKFADIIEQKKQAKKTADNQFENQAPLYVRLEEAITGLNVGTDLYCVIKSLYNLDTITTLSPKLCVEFTNKGLMPMLYQYLQSANRSEPNKLMAIAILRVFINLARFELTAPILWKVTLMVDGLNTIVDLIKIWYGKNEELMCAATTLLWLFAMKPENIEVINSTENLSKKLLYVFTQLDRKKPKKPSAPLTLPGAKADWGLGYRRKVFTHPLYAVTTVCRKLGLVGGEDPSRVSIASTGHASSRLRSVKIAKHSF